MISADRQEEDLLGEQRADHKNRSYLIGKVAAATPQRDLWIRDILRRMRHDDCSGRLGGTILLVGG